ncbi:GntR family transcriptional regulator [Mesorhizobium xinjiangense]|uniref:GntR family transcriptional regulator n=1 Tax=Mesorhizobium xinjiangense TaxID=2678685 RepID=UPI001F3629D1|nr:GntR family transcriptional regulator [Mesorhizobium xinjiangense]
MGEAGKTERAPRLAGGATERIVDALREAIVTLEMAPGTMLDKSELTARFGVSRFPVAEALNRLKAEGLVDIKPQSGSTVSLIRVADVQENMFLRRALEAETVALIALRHDEALLAELRRNLRYQKAAVDAEDRQGFYQLDLAFHDTLVSAIGYERVRATVEKARLALDRVRRLLGSPRRHAVTYQEHCAIVAALEQGDAVAARQAMVAHIDAVMRELEAFCDDNPGVFVDR